MSPNSVSSSGASGPWRRGSPREPPAVPSPSRLAPRPGAPSVWARHVAHLELVSGARARARRPRRRRLQARRRATRRGRIDESVLADEVERSLDAAGWDTPHVVGNSLGGYVALQLAARGRASVVALAPAGGFAEGDESYRETLAYHESMLAAVKAAAPHADAILASPKSSAARRATRPRTSNTSPSTSWLTRSAVPPLATRGSR